MLHSPRGTRARLMLLLGGFICLEMCGAGARLRDDTTQVTVSAAQEITAVSLYVTTFDSGNAQSPAETILLSKDSDGVFQTATGTRFGELSWSGSTFTVRKKKVLHTGQYVLPVRDLMASTMGLEKADRFVFGCTITAAGKTEVVSLLNYEPPRFCVYSYFLNGGNFRALVCGSSTWKSEAIKAANPDSQLLFTASVATWPNESRTNYLETWIPLRSGFKAPCQFQLEKGTLPPHISLIGSALRVSPLLQTTVSTPTDLTNLCLPTAIEMTVADSSGKKGKARFLVTPNKPVITTQVRTGSYSAALVVDTSAEVFDKMKSYHRLPPLPPPFVAPGNEGRGAYYGTRTLINRGTRVNVLTPSQFQYAGFDYAVKESRQWVYVKGLALFDGISVVKISEYDRFDRSFVKEPLGYSEVNAYSD